MRAILNPHLARRAPADRGGHDKVVVWPRELPEEGMKPRSISGTARYLLSEDR